MNILSKNIIEPLLRLVKEYINKKNMENLINYCEKSFKMKFLYNSLYIYF